MGDQVTLDGRNGRPPWRSMTKVFAARSAQEHAKHLLPYIQPSARILDVGCGLGSITIDLADLAPEGHVVGIDSNPDTTQAAEQTAKAAGTLNVEFQIRDVHDLSAFEAGSFDIVHAHQVLLHLPDPVKAIKEIRRVLKDGGIFATRDNILFRTFPEDSVLDEATETVRKWSANQGANLSGGTCNHVWVHEAGFAWDSIRIEHATWGFTTWEGRRTWAEGAKSSLRPLALAGDSRTAADFEVIREHWEQWAEKDEAKLYAIDGVVLAWK